MSKVIYGSKANRTIRIKAKETTKTARSPEEVVRELKQGQTKPPGEDYREKALAMFGLICARCGREFDSANRHLLTVHHKDGNHQNNPPDGSNWENLCAYCHEDVHSREMLGNYMGGETGGKENSLVYKGGAAAGWNALGDKLKKALKNE